MRRDAMGHEWRWSPACNGRATCRRCGLKRREKAGAGPRGGVATVYTFGCVEVDLAPCEPRALLRRRQIRRVGSAPRAKGHGRSGGNVWSLA